MQLSHREAAEHHEKAAKAHRTAAEHNEKGEHPDGTWHAQRALEHADKAHTLAQEAHTKSNKIESL